MSLYNDKDIIQEIEITEKDIALQTQKTNLVKKDFINKIKSGLGREIKNNPRGVKIIKKTPFEKIKDFIRKIFLKF